MNIAKLAFAAALMTCGAAKADDRKCWVNHISHPCTQAENDAHNAKLHEIYDKFVSGECPLMAGETPGGAAAFIVNFWPFFHGTSEDHADCKNP